MRMAWRVGLLVALLASLAARPVVAKEVFSTGDTTTDASTTDNVHEVVRSNTKRAIASQGSSCPWRYVGTYYAPATPDAAVSDALDPVSRRMIRVYVDCNGEPHGVLEPSPEEIATAMWERVQASIPLPSVGMEPVFTTGAVVNVDTWFWLEGGRDPITVTESLLGVSTTITMRPVTLTADWGDGNTSTCAAPGVDFATVEHPTLLADPDPAPDGCSYRYRRHSGSQPGKKYTVIHSVEWHASWRTADGLAGSFQPVTRESTTALRVVQYQAIGTANP